MAEGTVRIVREPDKEPGRQAPSINVSESEFDIPTRKSGRDSASKSTSDPRRNSETQRSSLSVEDRGNESESVGSPSPSRQTPSPRGRKPIQKVSYMNGPEAKRTAEYLVSAVEMVGVVTTGPVGEMTPFERGILIPPTARILERTPVELVGKFSPLIDGAAVVIGLGMYIMRVSSGVKGNTKQTIQNVQEDTASPIAAQATQTVPTTRAGDVDGIAPPVPNVIRQYMNGSM